ncbi:MAG: hypothetical protein DRO06_04730 [Thermoproteota archaeon]|nr:MAG: hypothetical protein DRO06_04730 [Candidatus Korarchaeota archaeon]
MIKVRTFLVRVDSGRYVGVALTSGGELACNTIPLRGRAEADAELRASCVRAWRDVEFCEGPPSPLAEDVANRVLKLFFARPANLIGPLLKPSERVRRVLETVYAIPPGRVATYSAVARLSGTSPRMAGLALSKNPFPLVIPCHRVVRADLSLGGYSYGEVIKADLLVREGVEVDLRSGKVDPRFLVSERELNKRRLLARPWWGSPV